MDVRKEIANRLKYELRRRNLTSSQAGNISGISEDNINNYLVGKREINFSEIKAVCSGLGINPVRLLYSENYPYSKLAFRNLQHDIQRFATKIEDTFLLIKELLPVIAISQLSRFDKKGKGYERIDIITEAAGSASKIQLQYKTPEQFITKLSIPVFPISCPEVNFDAFVISHEAHAAICVNTNKPPQRIRFSLAHEIAHLLYDRESDVPVDVFIPDLYWKTKVDPNEVPEFFAYKFAEFYLIPFDKLVPVVKKWPSLDKGKCQILIDEGETSKDVLANAIYDAYAVESNFFIHQSGDHNIDYEIPASGDQFRRMDWEEQREPISRELSDPVRFKHIQYLLSDLKASEDAKRVYSFLEECKQKVALSVKAKRDSFSDDVFAHISKVLQLE